MPKAPTPLRRKAMEGQEKPDQDSLHLKEQLARALADYDNFRKRTLERADQERIVITARVIGRFLPIIDMLYEAQKHLNDAGVALTIKEFEDTLKAEGIEAISPEVGEDFTEELHEAVDTEVRDDLKNGQITECLMRGWQFKDGQVIRHAKVKVNKLEQ